MADDWQAYVSDPRTICKYGTRCYQKNDEHHQKYKHPPKLKQKDTSRIKRKFSPYSRESPKRNHSLKLDDNPETSSNEKTNETPKQLKKTNKTDDIQISDDGYNTHDKITIQLPQDLTFYDKDTDHKIFKELFLVNMPKDFFNFYEFISSQSQSVKDLLGSVNLEAIGPFDLLLGELPVLEDKELYLVHWRFFYDPPEFQSILKKKKNSEYHFGYFRDDPEEEPSFVAANDSSKDCHITPIAENIFGAVYLHLQNEKKSSPFSSMTCQKLMDKLKKYSEENGTSLEEYTIKKRSSKMVTRTLHGAGIVVPYNKKTQLGYRHLVETDANLRKLFASLEKAKNQSDKDKILSELQPVITYASIAVDESDFGTGLEAGIDLFCSGLKELESSALSSLSAVYTLLNRTPFIKIFEAHLKYRRKGANMSILASTS